MVSRANSFVDVNLRSFTVGMASNATYTVADSTNGTVTLLADGQTARFTPEPQFFGKASFGFVCSDTLPGGGMTNVVKLLITPPPPQPRFESVHPVNRAVVLSGAGGTPGFFYHLLRATNVALPWPLWSRVATNQFDQSGNFTTTNSPDSNAGQSFYRLVQP